MQDIVYTHARETAHGVDSGPKLRIECYTQFRGEQVPVVLIRDASQDRLSLRDCEVGIILGSGN